MFRNHKSLLAGALVAGALVAPAAAQAQTSAQASVQLAIQANADSSAALAQADRSPARARKLVASAQSKLARAYEKTIEAQQRANARAQDAIKVANRFAEVVRKDQQRMAVIARDSRGSLQGAATKALANDAKMEAGVAIQAVVTFERGDAQQQAQASGSLSAIGEGFGDGARRMLSLASARQIAKSGRDRLRNAVAVTLDAQRRLAAALAESGERGRESAQAHLDETRDAVVAGAHKLAGAVEQSSESGKTVQVPGEGRLTLGELAVHVTKSMEAGDGSGSPKGSASASGSASVSGGGASLEGQMSALLSVG
jgi:hypothetical protein